MNLIAAAAVAAMTCVPVQIEVINNGHFVMHTNEAGIVALCGPGPVFLGPNKEFVRMCIKNKAAVGAIVTVDFDRHFTPEADDTVCAKPMED